MCLNIRMSATYTMYTEHQGSHSHWKSGKNWKSEILFPSQRKISEFDKFETNMGKIREFDQFDKISWKNLGIKKITKYK